GNEIPCASLRRRAVRENQGTLKKRSACEALVCQSKAPRSHSILLPDTVPCNEPKATRWLPRARPAAPQPPEAERVNAHYSQRQSRSPPANSATTKNTAPKARFPLASRDLPTSAARGSGNS